MASSMLARLAALTVDADFPIYLDEDPAVVLQSSKVTS